MTESQTIATAMVQYGTEKAETTAFVKSLNKHIAYVREAGRVINVPQTLLMIHDNSKWTSNEFPAYAKHFEGDGAPNEFARAWLHHIHHNPHHWQHWIFPDGHTPKGSDVENGVVEMPEEYALEMIADWMGSSKAYTGSWDMTDWLQEHKHKIRVHRKTSESLQRELGKLGYADIVIR